MRGNEWHLPNLLAELFYQADKMTKRIPLNDLARQNLLMRDDLAGAVGRVIERGW